MKTFGYIMAICLALFLLAVVGRAFRIISLPFWKLDKQIEMNRDIIEKTYDADNAIYNYEWFKQRYEAILALEKKIVIAQASADEHEKKADARGNWTFSEIDEQSRLNAVTQGNKSQYEDIVAEYNSRAKMVNRNIFQDDLPTFFTLKPY